MTRRTPGPASKLALLGWLALAAAAVAVAAVGHGDRTVAQNDRPLAGAAFRDAGGDPVPGGCVIFSAGAERDARACDQESGDEADAPGDVAVRLVPGGYDFMLLAPPGYRLAEGGDGTMEIGAGAPDVLPETLVIPVGEADATLTIRALACPADFGNPVAECQGNGLAGVTFSVDGQPMTTDAAGDARLDVPAGGLNVSEDPAVAAGFVGTYVSCVDQTTGEGLFATGPPLDEPLGGIGFSIEAGQTVACNWYNLTAPASAPAASPVASPGAAVDGAVAVGVEDGTSEPVAGACFAVYPAAADDFGSAPVGGACSDTSGMASIRPVPAGDYVLVQTTAPPDHRPASYPIRFRVVADAVEQTTYLTVENLPLGDVGFTASAAGDSGSAGEIVMAPGACVAVYTVRQGGPGDLVGHGCDADDGAADGTTWVRHLPPGEYVLVETSAPPGYARVADLTFLLLPGADVEVDVDHQALPGAGPVTAEGELGVLVVEVVAASGEPVGGACVEVGGSAEVYQVCDDEAGDADPAPGRIELELPADEYFVGIIRAPEGHVPAATGQTVAVVPAEVATIRFVLEAA